MPRDRLSLILLFLPLLVPVVLAKISVPQLALLGLSVVWPIMMVVTAFGLFMARFSLHGGRLMAFLVLAIWIGATQLIVSGPFSVTSLMLFAGLYVPCLLMLKAQPGETDDAGADWTEIMMRGFSNFAVFIAVLGIVQYGLQYLTGPTIAFPLEHFVPEAFSTGGYNRMNPLQYGSTIYKSNGVFFLEPSFCSQFIGLALVLEATLWARKLRLALLFVALACTFSGTGLIVLAVGMSALILLKRRWDLVGAFLLIGLIALLFASELKLDLILNRSEEFSTPGSSGFARFVAWLTLLDDQFWGYPKRVLFGSGAGQFASFSALARYDTAEMSFAKAVFEFGVIGAFLYFGFLAYLIASSQLPTPIKLGLFTCILMNGAYSESITGLVIALACWPGRDKSVRPAATPIAVNSGFFSSPHATH